MVVLSHFRAMNGRPESGIAFWLANVCNQGENPCGGRAVEAGLDQVLPFLPRPMSGAFHREPSFDWSAPSGGMLSDGALLVPTQILWTMLSLRA